MAAVSQLRERMIRAGGFEQPMPSFSGVAEAMQVTEMDRRQLELRYPIASLGPFFDFRQVSAEDVDVVVAIEIADVGAEILIKPTIDLV